MLHQTLGVIKSHTYNYDMYVNLKGTGWSNVTNVNQFFRCTYYIIMWQRRPISFHNYMYAYHHSLLVYTSSYCHLGLCLANNLGWTVFLAMMFLILCTLYQKTASKASQIARYILYRTLHMYAGTRVLAGLIRVKLQNLVCVLTVVLKFDMRTRDWIQATQRDACHKLALGFPHYTCSVITGTYSSCRQWITAVLQLIGFLICCNEHRLKVQLKSYGLTKYSRISSCS